MTPAARTAQAGGAPERRRPTRSRRTTRCLRTRRRRLRCQWAERVAAPWADFEHAGIAKLKAEPGHEVYPISDAQLAQWKQAAGPVIKTWADGVKKRGGDPDAVLNSLKADLAKANSGY